MTIRAYSFADAGVPPTTDASYTTMNVLGRILDACLVDGIAGKPGAGWTRIAHVLGSWGAWKSASGKTILMLRYQGTNHVSVTLMDTHAGTELTTRLDGENIRSGYVALQRDTAATSEVHRIRLDEPYTSSYRYAFRWCLFADEESFVFSSSSSPTTASTTNYQSRAELYVGEFVNYSGLKGKSEVIALGGINNPTNQGNNGKPFAGGGCTILRNPINGLMNFPVVYAGMFLELGTSSDLYQRTLGLEPEIQIPNLNFTPVALKTANYSETIGSTSYDRMGRYVGRLRGVVYEPIIGYYSPAICLRALGLSTGYEDMHRPVLMDDGHYYAVCGTTSPDLLYFLTTNPDFW